jgi:7SK snRNA methylphosphate capping enzyme
VSKGGGGGGSESAAAWAPPFDTICAFSVTKWVHLSGGDAAIKALFRKAHALLAPGGAFVLEAQPWRSYSK